MRSVRIFFRHRAWRWLGALALLPLWAWGAEPVQQAFTLSTGWESDSNPRMDASNAGGVVRYKLLPQYTYTHHADAAEWSVAVGAHIERSSQSDLSANRQDPSARFKWQNSTPTATWGVNASYVRASTRDTQFEETGLVTSDRTQTTQNVGASWARQITERWSIQTNANHQAVSYDTSALTGYSNTSVAAGLSFDWAPDQTVSFNLSSSHYVPDSPALVTTRQRSSSNGFTLGYTAKLSPNVQWLAQLGGVQVSGDTSDSTWQGNWQLSQQGERLGGSVSVGRAVVPSGILGGFTASNTLRLQSQYALTDRSGLGASYSRTQSSAQGSNLSGRSTSSLGLSYSHDLSADWQLQTTLQRKTAHQPSGQASATTVGVNLNYSLPDF